MAAYPSLKSFLASLGTERQCQWLLCKVRWPDGDCCPRCDSRKVNLVASAGTRRGDDRILHRCQECDYHFSETSGTVFHDSRLDLRAWFLATYLMGSIEGGIRPAQLETYLGVSHDTALNMVARIRKAIRQDPHFVRKHVWLPKLYATGIEPAPPSKKSHPTLHAVVERFQTEQRSREQYARVLERKVPRCQFCQKPAVQLINSKGSHVYRCLLCKKRFSVTARSVFHKIRRLSEWFIALYLVESSPRGISAKQVQRLLGISYRTAVARIKLMRDLKSRREIFERFIVEPTLVEPILVEPILVEPILKDYAQTGSEVPRRVGESSARQNIQVGATDPQPGTKDEVGESAQLKNPAAIAREGPQPAMNYVDGVGDSAETKGHEEVADLKPKLRKGIEFVSTERPHNIPPYSKPRSVEAVDADASQPVTKLSESLTEPVEKKEAAVAPVASPPRIRSLEDLKRLSINRKNPFEVE